MKEIITINERQYTLSHPQPLTPEQILKDRITENIVVPKNMLE